MLIPTQPLQSHAPAGKRTVFPHAARPPAAGQPESKPVRITDEVTINFRMFPIATSFWKTVLSRLTPFKIIGSIAMTTSLSLAGGYEGWHAGHSLTEPLIGTATGVVIGATVGAAFSMLEPILATFAERRREKAWERLLQRLELSERQIATRDSRLAKDEARLKKDEAILTRILNALDANARKILESQNRVNHLYWILNHLTIRRKTPPDP